MDIEQEFLVVDPVLGDVSCSSEADAREYAKNVDGTVVLVSWLEGKVVGRETLT